MATEPKITPSDCTCLAVRQAARHVSQFYDQYLAPSGLRTTQFSVLSKLKNHGPLTINALAAEMVMDRTTLGRNILPLERDRLIEIRPGRSDRRSKELYLTTNGAERLQQARAGWREAQTRFAEAFGEQRTAALRTMLRSVTATELPAAQS